MQPVRRVRSIAAATGSIGRILIDRAAAQGEAEPFDPTTVEVGPLTEPPDDEARHFDGSNPQLGMSNDGGPGWMVDAVGTFIGEDPAHGRIDSRGTQGFHLFSHVAREP